jgi:DNA invertase Pin-like site-specific DNA recombinase
MGGSCLNSRLTRLHLRRAAVIRVDILTPGRLMLCLVGAVAQFKREMMLERQREGIAQAKAEGKYKGRKPTAALLADKVREMHGQGQSMGAIATALGIGKGSVHRAIRAGS